MTPTTEELKALLEKATPGPWHYRPQKFDDWGYVRASVRPDGWQPFICQAKNDAEEEVVNAARKAGIDPWGANARLIALAPTLAARVVALEEVAGWQPIETMPKVGPIDIWIKGRGRVCGVRHPEAYRGVIHWMPLPPAPKEGE